jgi:GT2 family glycosyltransferase
MREGFFIAVCTLGEHPNLTRCLANLLEISEVSLETVQIIVVMNKESSEIEFDPKLLIVYEPARGYSNARNAAIAAVPKKSNLIFLDDDEIPTLSWLEAIIDSHRRFPRDVIFGPVFSDSDPNSGYYRENFKSTYESMSDGTLVKQASTANMLIPSYLLDNNRVVFDPIFNLSGSEDTDLCFRLRKQGVGIRYSKQAVIKEVQTDQRRDSQYLTARRLRDICNYSVVIRRNSSFYEIAWRFVTLASRVILYSIVSIFFSEFRFEAKLYFMSLKALLNGKVT